MNNYKLFYIATCALLMTGFLACEKKSVPPPTNQNWYFSPIPSIGVGPNGLATKKIDLKPYCCPSDAIEITSATGASDGDFQWVNVPISLPAGKINAVTVCYQVQGGSSFISQVRLAKMTLPNSASVVHDDPTDLKSTSPTCYTSKVGGAVVDGTITLSLRIAVAVNESIRVGGISVDLTPN